MTIGLAFLVAVMQTLALVRKDETWDRLSRFFGRIFLISLAVGVVTGIVLELSLIHISWKGHTTPMGRDPGHGVRTARAHHGRLTPPE